MNPRKRKSRITDPDEPYLISPPPPASVPIEETPGFEFRNEEIEVMSSEEASRTTAEPQPEREEEPAAIPDVYENEVSEDELPEPIDESVIPDEDVPEEEMQPEVVVDAEDEEKEIYKAPSSPVRRMLPRQSYSPLSEQYTTAPRLSGDGLAGGPMSDTTKILLLLGGVVVVGVAIYFLKKA